MSFFLLLTGCFAAGFLFGLAVAALYRLYRVRNYATWFVRQSDKRKHSQRAPQKVKFLKRARYRVGLRNFRLDPRSNRGW